MALKAKSALLATALIVASSATWADGLSDVYKLALDNDAKLKSAKAAYEAGKEAAVQTRAGILPSVNFQANLKYTDQTSSSSGSSTSTPTDIPPPSAVTDPIGFAEFVGQNTAQSVSDSLSESLSPSDTTHDYAISAEQPLFDMAKWHTYKQGAILTEMAATNLRDSEQDLIIRVAEAYFDVLRGIDNLESDKAEEAAIQRQLEQTKQRFDVGLIAITDVHEAQAAYDLVVVKRIATTGQLAIAYEALEALTGQAHPNIDSLKADYPVALPAPTERGEWVNIALKNNLQLQLAEQQMRSAEKDARSKKAGHYPTLTASASHQVNSDGLYEDTTLLQLQLTVPLYNGGGVSSQRRQAYNEYIQAQEDNADARRNIIQATRGAYLQVQTDVATVNAYKQSIRSAQSALDATQAGYDVGTRNVVDVLVAQNGLYGARRNYANARYDYVVDMLRLKQYAGTLSHNDIYELEQWMVAQ